MPDVVALLQRAADLPGADDTTTGSLGQLMAATAHAYAGQKMRPGLPGLDLRIALLEAKMADSEIILADGRVVEMNVPAKALPLADKIREKLAALDAQTAQIAADRATLAQALAFLDKYPESEAILHALSSAVSL